MISTYPWGCGFFQLPVVVAMAEGCELLLQSEEAVADGGEFWFGEEREVGDAHEGKWVGKKIGKLHSN